MLRASGITAFKSRGKLYQWNLDASASEKTAVARVFMRAVLEEIHRVLEDAMRKYATIMRTDMSLGFKREDILEALETCE